MCMIRSRAITGRPILSIGIAGGITSATNVEATKTPPGQRTLLISATYEKITNIIRTFTNRYKVGGNRSWIKNIVMDGSLNFNAEV